MMPKIRSGSSILFFVTERKHSEAALIQVVQEAVVQGISTQKMEKLAKGLGIDGISRSQVSEMTKGLQEQVDDFRHRHLTAKGYDRVSKVQSSEYELHYLISHTSNVRIFTMATTRIIPMHQNKGKSLAQCLMDRTDYAKNPEKTKDGELVSCFECDAKTIDSQFLLSKREYKAITGRTQESDVIAYQIRQSFKPGEVTPEQANQIGYQFALRFTKGEHAFMVATHTDKRHIHNHIIWNSTALDCTHKFRNFWGSTQAVRRLSDLLCAEQKLSVIQEAKPHGIAYNTWLGNAAKRSNRAMLRSAIEQALASAPATLDELLQLLARQGYRVKRGKHISLRPPHAQRYIRLSSLGSGFSQAELLAALSKSKAHIGKDSAVTYQQTKFNLLVDIQRKMREGKGTGYERWAKVFNLKQMAQTLNYLTENNCENYANLSRKASEARDAFNALSEQLRITEQRLRELSALRTHLFNYLKTRDIYVAYRKAGYSKNSLRSMKARLYCTGRQKSTSIP